MKAFEISFKVTEHRELELPYALKEVLPHGHVVRVITPVNESAAAKEQEAWSRLTIEQFLSG
ncbi:MAG: hypothetical protein Q8Q12_17425 [bacterium]|nr:hypothetical protein [bacterium]